MTLDDFVRVCTFPLWVNDDGFSVVYNSRAEVERYLPSTLIEVCYVTTNGDGELVVEI